MVRTGGPHLLAARDPLRARQLGRGGQAGEVRTGSGLAEELAPRLLAGQDRTEEALAEFVRAMGHDRRPRESGARAEGLAHSAGRSDLRLDDTVRPAGQP